MSRSNPHVNAPNPAVRWFEWNGEHGTVRYYDKDAKKNIDVKLPFQFLLLDELASVRGWHDASDSGIYSNEVKDTRTEVLVVKSFKGGTLAEGKYKDIKDRVGSLGGQYVANCYIAFRVNENELAIGSLRFKGSALGAWMEFRKAIGRGLYHKAIVIDGYAEGKKGRIVFRTPTFKPAEVSDATNEIAMDLDREFQEWLTGYFDRRTADRAEPPSDDEEDEQDGEATPEAYARHREAHSEPLTDDDIPFAWALPFVLPAMLALHGVLA